MSFEKETWVPALEPFEMFQQITHSRHGMNDCVRVTSVCITCAPNILENPSLCNFCPSYYPITLTAIRRLGRLNGKLDSCRIGLSSRPLRHDHDKPDSSLTKRAARGERQARKSDLTPITHFQIEGILSKVHILETRTGDRKGMQKFWPIRLG